MLNFNELKDLVVSGEDEPFETAVADLESAPSFKLLPSKLILQVFESDFPEVHLWRTGKNVICEITEHIYTKLWEHKYHGRVFADAMVRAITRLGAEGHPLANPEIENDDDPHIFVRWQVIIPTSADGNELVASVRAAFDLVWSRANAILDDSDSVLILGKDTGAGLARLRRIEAALQQLGYFTYIIKDQPDRLGETVLQKVLRFAMSSRFVIVENTEASGHLYEVPHVGKMAECVTAFLQETGKGATWMFADAYFRQTNWNRFSYAPANLERAVRQSVTWAEKFVAQFGKYQQRALPWMKPSIASPRRARRSADDMI